MLYGSDTVYKVSDKFFIQCFCPKDGSQGIQSVWMNESWVPGANQQNLLLRQGWMKIPNGPQWGLPEGSYFVINNTYDCKECIPQGQGNGIDEPGNVKPFTNDNTSNYQIPAQNRFCTTTSVNGQTQTSCSSY